MTGPDVNAILIQLTELRATIVTRLDGLAADNLRGENVHIDHEQRLRALEASASEGRGVLRLITAGGAVGALLAGVVALTLRSFGV